LTQDDYLRKLEETIVRNQELEKEIKELKQQKELLEKENEDLKKR
jgi:FtsZ-binding cell division protein ZapB